MPELDRAKQLIEERAGIYTQMIAINQAPEGEDGALTSEQEQEWQRLDARYEELTGEIAAIEEKREQESARAERLGKIDEALKASRKAVSRQITDPESAKEVETAEQLEARHKQVFDRYLRRGWMRITAEDQDFLDGLYSDRTTPVLGAEARAQGVGSDPLGGYLVPDLFSDRFEQATRAYGGMRSVAEILTTTSGANLPIPTMDDTSNTGALIAENTADSETGVTIGQIVAHAYTYTSRLILLSRELLGDDQYDLVGKIASIGGERIGRITNTHFTSGDGASKPYGIAVQCTSGKTAAAVDAVTFDELMDLEHAVDISYRNMGARWMFHDLTLKALKKLKDGEGRPLWLSGLAVGEPPTIDGFPYTVNNDMPQMATGNKAILFGALGKYLIRDVRGQEVVRLNERYAENRQVGFFVFSRHDGVLQDAGQHPVQCITMA